MEYRDTEEDGQDDEKKLEDRKMDKIILRTMGCWEDSLISMADGTRKEIWKVEVGDEVLSLDEESGRLVSNEVVELFDMGVKPIYELTTESGKKINTTGNHPYLVIRKRSGVWDWILEKINEVVGNG